jgi:hypothetical protein
VAGFELTGDTLAAFEPATLSGVVYVRNFEVNQQDNYRLIARLLGGSQQGMRPSYERPPLQLLQWLT